ncbi:MAG: hypothetical protein LBB41_06300 [Prevotellaceae bacterium]|nr:hypothetical protein [Prevotellaceae bacterium]
MAKGKKMTRDQMKRIVSTARTIRKNAGSRKVTRTETKYNMKWTDAIRRAAKKVLHPTRQTSIRFKKK